MNENGNKLLLNIPEVMAATNLGRTKIYELLGNGALESVTVGRRRMVAAAALDDWVARLRRKCSNQI